MMSSPIAMMTAEFGTWSMVLLHRQCRFCWLRTIAPIVKGGLSLVADIFPQIRAWTGFNSRGGDRIPKKVVRLC